MAQIIANNFFECYQFIIWGLVVVHAYRRNYYRIKLLWNTLDTNNFSFLLSNVSDFILILFSFPF